MMIKTPHAHWDFVSWKLKLVGGGGGGGGRGGVGWGGCVCSPTNYNVVI